MRDLRNIGIAKIQAKRNRGTRLRNSCDHCRVDIEVRYRVSVNQRAITGAETFAGILHRSAEGIPVNSLRGPVITCRQRSVEVIHFEISVYLHERQTAVDSAVEVCPSMDCERQFSGTVGSQQQRLPFLDVMAGP